MCTTLLYLLAMHQVLSFVQDLRKSSRNPDHIPSGGKTKHSRVDDEVGGKQKTEDGDQI